MTSSTISADLAANARKHKSFLAKLHELGITQQRASDQSVHRYLDLWLPLTSAECGNSEQQQRLLPPPDVAWLWHVHRLSPQQYISYCRNHFHGDIVEASPPFVLQWEKVEEKESEGEEVFDDAASTTRAIWTRMYPDEPFFLKERISQGGAGKKVGVNADPTADGFDLIGSAIRQMGFLWQISGERFDDQDFLEDGVENYLRFLRMNLHAAASNIILVPTYQIDLMWHTHMLTNMKLYVEDCVRILGRMLRHDDSLTDRSEGGVLETNYHATAKLWNDFYDGQEYCVDGGMYRGEPPEQFYDTDWNANGIPISSIIRVMGASSASFEPTQWADPKGFTSDNSPAFISACAKQNPQRKDLKDLAKRDNYILMRGSEGVGYYHLETKEAAKEIATRCRRNIANIESDIACERCCCGSSTNIKRKEEELRAVRRIQLIMDARWKASRPSSRPSQNDWPRWPTWRATRPAMCNWTQ